MQAAERLFFKWELMYLFMYMIYLGGRAKMMKKKEEEVIRRGTRRWGRNLCPQSICATPHTHYHYIYIFIMLMCVCDLHIICSLSRSLQKNSHMNISSAVLMIFMMVGVISDTKMFDLPPVSPWSSRSLYIGLFILIIHCVLYIKQ